MKNKFINGLLMAVVAITATAITTTGLPNTVPGWEILGITTVGTVLTYTAKNFIFPDVSLFGTINLADMGSGLFMAIGTGLSSWAASAVADTAIHWPELFSLVGTIFLTYIAKKILSAQQGKEEDKQVLNEAKKTVQFAKLTKP
jgi:hypothetical protein